MVSNDNNTASPKRASTSAAAMPKRVTMPPPPARQWRVWGMLLLGVMVCLPPLVIDLTTTPATHDRELELLLTARQTWTNANHIDGADWVVPTRNGRPQYTHPPLPEWTTMLTWFDLDADAASSDTLVRRSRWLALLLGVITLAATYWAAYNAGGVRVGRTATLVVGTTMPFVWFARFDSADLHLLAWSTMTVAAGLWAMRPMRPMSWLGRRVTGWFLAGIALAAAALSKGPIALVYTVVPLAGAIAVTRTRRLSNIMGLLFSILLGVLIALLWYLHVAEQHKDAVERWFNAWTGADLPPQPAVYYLLILLVVFPWTVTIVGSLAQPFLQASGEFRRRLLIGWVWFVALGVILSIPVAKDLRLALPLMPAVGLLVAQIWSHHGNLAGEGIPDPGINLIRVPHWLGLIVASIALPVFIVLQSDFVESGRITQPLLAGINTPVAATLLAVLLIITLVGAVSHWRWKPGTAFLATFIWMIVALTVIAFGHSRNHTGPTHAAVTASGMLDVVGHKPVYRLIETDPNDDAINDDPSTALLFYYGRPIIPSTLGTLTRRADQPCYVLVARDQPGADTLLDADYTLVARIDDRDGYALYSSPGATRQTTETQP